MTTIIITGVIALAVGFILGYLLINMTLKYRSKNIIKEAEAEAEVIKKDKILQAKEKFLQIKAEHEKQVNARNSKILLAENKLKQKDAELARKMEEMPTQDQRHGDTTRDTERPERVTGKETRGTG